MALIFPFLSASFWLPVLLVSSLTEFFDGFLARLLNATTNFGRILDPIADKVFIISVAGTLLGKGYLSILDLILISIRDIVVVIGSVILFISKGKKILSQLKPVYTGKIATFFQFVFVGSVVFLKMIEPWILYSTVAFSSVAAIDYLRLHARIL